MRLLPPVLFVLMVPFVLGLHAADTRPDLTWRLTAGPSADQPSARATLTWLSVADFDLSQPTWRLFFNFPLAIEPLAPATGLAVRHVNGDLWEIAPLPGFKPGPSLALDLVFEAAALNFSIGPAGPFWRADPNADAKVLRIQHITPPAALMTRGPQDQMPVADAADRYQRNRKSNDGAATDVRGILPTPREQVWGTGRRGLNDNPRIVYDPAFANEARYLRDFFGRHFQWQAVLVPAKHGAQADIRLLQKVDPQADPRERAEGYQLSIRPDRPIELSAEQPAGAFYAVQSLLALIKPEAWREKPKALIFDSVAIKDAPRFAYRGFHLDVARHFHDAETVRRTLDLMALYKLNRFHFHLTDDEGWRLAIQNYPELTNYGATRGTGADDLVPSFGSGAAQGHQGSGAYDRATFVGLLRYAAERHIEVIPEIDLPGHARAAIQAIDKRRQKGGDTTFKAFEQVSNLRDSDDASSYKSVQGWKDNVICVCRPDAYRFIEQVISDLESMYEEAGLTLKVVHAGGDEVPKGVWLDSPACKKFMAEKGFTESKHLFAYFFEELHRALAKRNIVLAGWEEIALLEDHGADDPHRTFNEKLKQPPARTHVWNDIPGFGREALAYQLANNGFEVVLSSAAHMYFDLAYEKDYREPGYYWAGYIDTFKVFRFSPYNIYAGGAFDRMGRPINPDSYRNHERLSAAGRQRIIGIQGQLWSETVTTRERLEYMLLPKLFGLAERAWAAQPKWETAATSPQREAALARDWMQFAHRVGKVELPKLDGYNGGYAYRLPPPGARVDAGRVYANSPFPGLTIRYTTDGSEPTVASARYEGPIEAAKTVKLAVFDRRGRASRVAEIVIGAESAEQKGPPTP